MPPKPTRPILATPSRWFRIDGPIDQGDYFSLGLLLAIIKYLLEVIAVFVLAGEFFTPWQYLNPWLDSRASFLQDAPYVAIIWFVSTIPFIVIAITASIRRAIDAEWNPWWGMTMLIPIVNMAFMALFCVLPSRSGKTEISRKLDPHIKDGTTVNAFAPPETVDDWSPRTSNGVGAEDPVVALLIGIVAQVGIGAISVWGLGIYGFILFFSSPILSSAVVGFLMNRRFPYGKLFLLAIVLLLNVLSFVAMLMIGLDGAICLAMAFPLITPLSLVGGFIGRAIAITSHSTDSAGDRRGAYGALAILPMCLLLEPLDDQRTISAVNTSVTINAPTSVVWQQVIAFPEIDERPAWFFRLGIAAPIRAHIEGSGVDACRYCEFTTGPFVEPITSWQPPTGRHGQAKLAFDVLSQPRPMHEWTPWSGLHPPHIEKAFVSRHGQFLLRPIGPNQTELVGTTWYDIDVRPRLYWKSWADPTIHAIHRRVLGHIKRCSETEDRRPPSS